MSRAVHVRITGKVQGVSFRYWTVEEATRLELNGWVRNRPDTSVEAVFAGSDNAVAEMLGLCHRGPRHARVDNVEVSDWSGAVPAGFGQAG
jgi:acylphosphatase